MERLKELGLTQYEIDIYKTLLSEGTLMGSKIHKISKVPHGKTYESLVKLEEKGLVIVTKCKPKEYTAVNPKTAIQNLVRSQVDYLQDVKESSIHELEKLRSIRPLKEEMREKIKIGAGKKSIFPIVLDMYETAKKEVKEIFTYEVRPFAHIRVVNEALKRGVRVRFLISKKPQDLKQLKEDIRAGIEIRYFPIDELRFVIKDEQESIETLVNPRERNDRVSIYIQSPALSKALSSYFEEIWKKAEVLS
ncbi:TrmB family transcriptional regulator [Candidatus Woesearchaeota archaeon]|nr:TrmB family transcriptional regulator [Candidatus Woesearchaeota archaeon]